MCDPYNMKANRHSHSRNEVGMHGLVKIWYEFCARVRSFGRQMMVVVVGDEVNGGDYD